MCHFCKVADIKLYAAMIPKQLAFVPIGKFNAAFQPALQIRTLFCSSIKICYQVAKVLFIFVLN